MIDKKPPNICNEEGIERPKRLPVRKVKRGIREVKTPASPLPILFIAL